MSASLVSILMPCFNADRWVAQALESAIGQTWPAKEIILVDDGSEDASLAVARRYQARGVKVVHQANRGASAARNTALGIARGEYVQFLDADDLLAPDKIERQMMVLDGLEGRILASGPWARFFGQPQDGIFTPQPNWRDLSGVEFLQLHYEQGCMMHPAAWLAPRALLDKAGPWNETLSLNDDGEYFARVALASDRIVFCPEARSYYRSGLEASLSGRQDRRSLESLFRSVELTVQHLLAADGSQRTRDAAAHAWLWLAFELHPGHPELSLVAEEKCRAMGGSRRPLPGGRVFRLASPVIGWRRAKTLAQHLGSGFRLPAVPR